jgi:hypothetical protein
MSRATSFLLSGSILAAVGTAVGVEIAQQKVLAQSAAAFTATMREALYDQAGNVGRTQMFMVATRSDGSTVRQRTWRKPGNRGITEQRTIRDLTSREEIVVDGLTESITTIPLSKGLVAHYKRQGCADNDTASGEVILGYETVKVTKESGDGNGMVRIERSLAPALGCFALRTAYSHAEPGSASYRVVNVREAIDVRTGEPDPAWFTKPSGYVERSPSARRAEFYRRYPERQQPCPECMKNNDRDADEQYYSRQASGDR